MGVSKHLVAGLAILAAATLTPATLTPALMPATLAPAASGATESGYSVSGQVVETDRAPGSSTLWAIKHGMQWRHDYQGWDEVNYRITQYVPGEGWTVHSLPGVGRTTALDGLTVIADDDVWVSAGRRLIQWDGARWTTRFTSPSETSISVYASASDNVWSVVTYPGYGTPSYSLRRWDGDGWMAVTTPDSEHITWLFDLIPIGPDDVWAVGADEDWESGDDPMTALSWHWDGTDWSTQEVVDGSYNLGDADASADGATIWGIGGVLAPTSECDGAIPCMKQSAVARLTNGAWQPIQLPGDGAEINSTRPSIDSTVGGDAWVVGSRKSYTYLPLLARTLNGTWQYLDPPTDLCGDGRRLHLIDVDAETNDDVYAVGTCVQRRANFNEADDDYHTLVAHFDGEGWVRV